MKTGIAIAAILMAATGAFAEEPQAGEAAKEKKICRVERMTGSRIKTSRVCMTQAQWDELALRTKRGLDEMGRNAAGGANSGWDPAKNGQGGGL